jgi:hypothetical protein
MKIPEDRSKLPGFARDFIGGYFALPISLDLPKSAGKLAEASSTLLVVKEAAVDGSTSILVRELQPALQEADRIVQERIAAGKKVLQLKLGERWTLAHKEAGYSQGTLEMPKSMKGRARLLKKMGEFFTKNASWQNRDLDVTGELFLGGAGALSQALSAVESHAVAHKKLVKERDAAVLQLRNRLRTLKFEVSQVLAKDDVLWGTLGVESPAEARAKRAIRADQKKLKAEADASKAAAEKLETTQRKVEAARIKAEKARAKAERMLAAAASAQNDAVAAAEEVARLESAFEALGGNRLTLSVVSSRDDHGNHGVVNEESALVA